MKKKINPKIISNIPKSEHKCYKFNRVQRCIHGCFSPFNNNVPIQMFFT